MATIKIGRQSEYTMETFSGLFVYHGIGVGTYYSITGEEVFSNCDDARNRAEREGVKYVYQDSWRMPTKGQ